MKVRRGRRPAKGVVDVAPVTADELRRLGRALERRAPVSPDGRATPRKSTTTTTRGARPRTREGPTPPSLRWNPDADDVQRSVAQLVLTIVEFLRQLMERQALRRMDAGTLDAEQVETVGQALMHLEAAVRELGERFGLTPEDLNLDLGPIRLI